MEIQEFLEIGIVGAALSLFIQWAKDKFGTEGWATKGITLGLSAIVGTTIFFLSGTAIWTAIVGVLMASTTVYALLLK